ncbi:hypothetical protein DMC63_23250 [Streptomyces sp. WAC 05977]|nr:hypothetical protein DMC63_23250 [Streptomyces sp. WAC 05977]
MPEAVMTAVTHSRPTAAAIWHIRRISDVRYRVEFCCRGHVPGTFDVLIGPRSRARALATDSDLVLCAVGLLLDVALPAGHDISAEIDLDLVARTNQTFLPELRRRLGTNAP